MCVRVFLFFFFFFFFWGGGMVGRYFVLHYFVPSFAIISWERKLAGCFTLIAF